MTPIQLNPWALPIKRPADDEHAHLVVAASVHNEVNKDWAVCDTVGHEVRLKEDLARLFHTKADQFLQIAAALRKFRQAPRRVDQCIPHLVDAEDAIVESRPFLLRPGGKQDLKLSLRLPSN